MDTAVHFAAQNAEHDLVLLDQRFSGKFGGGHLDLKMIRSARHVGYEHLAAGQARRDHFFDFGRRNHDFMLSFFHMKLRFFALIPVLIISANTAAAESSHAERMKSMAINRSLLAAFEAEYTDKIQETLASPGKKREITNLKYKIEALNEESSRLSSSLSEKERAAEFLKDLIVKKEIAAAPVVFGKKTPISSVEKLEQIPALHEKALKFVADRKLRDAAALYEEITLIDPDDDQAYLIMGHCFLLTGEFARAEAAFENAVHIEASNVGEITPFYENMILNDPDDDMAYSQLGYAHLILGNREKAKSAFEDALTINSENPLAMSGYRIIHQTAAENSRAVQ